MSLTFGSLFAGIGGFDLGFERAGMVCKWQVEIDDYANRVLAKHWPNVHRERDIRQCGRHNLEPVDVICGGFPCQDISYAGQGAGLDGERSGLFFEAVRVVRELRPRIVVLENVAALLTRGLDRVLGTLAEIGFDAEWHCIPAAAVGAPHIRDRVFVLAYADANGSGKRCCNTDDQGWRAGRDREACVPPGRIIAGANIESASAIPDAAQHGRGQGHENSGGCGQRTGERKECRSGSVREDVADDDRGISGASWPGKEKRRAANMLVYGSESSGRNQWSIEPAVGRVADGVSNRVDRLRGLGNAVVPQVAEWIGKRIVAASV